MAHTGFQLLFLEYRIKPSECNVQLVAHEVCKWFCPGVGHCHDYEKMCDSASSLFSTSEFYLSPKVL